MSRRAQRKTRQSHRVMNALGKARRAMTHEPIVHVRAEDRLCPLFSTRGSCPSERAAIAQDIRLPDVKLADETQPRRHRSALIPIGRGSGSGMVARLPIPQVFP
jgi:hypothetical protein